MAKKTPQELGAEFEEGFRLYLKGLMQKGPAAFHRFYDTKSAGAYMPEQPADFLACFKGRAHLFELKSSDVHNSFAACRKSIDLLQEGQAANLRLWARAGAKVHLLFWQQRSGLIELWDGVAAAEARVTARAKLPREGNMLLFNTFDSFKEMFAAAIKQNPRFGAREE
jgi:hypothetical protein